MASFCDVALPVPIDRTFTYRLSSSPPAPAQAQENASGHAPGPASGELGLHYDPPVGGRVIVPFRHAKLIGVVTRLHEDPPPVEARRVESVLDREPILPLSLMELGAWLSHYYLAPIGEVLRMMLPLSAEVRRQTFYRITEAGQTMLLNGAEQGSSRRSRLTPQDQDVEYAVLNYLADGGPAAAAALSRATGASRELLQGMTRKKWLARESAASPRDARRMARHAVLVPEARTPKLNENQLAILAHLAGAGGSLLVTALRDSGFSASTLATLVKRGLVTIEDRAAGFHLSAMHAGDANPISAADLNRDQRAALDRILAVIAAEDFAVTLLRGVTGSGKTAVYLAAMRQVLLAGRAAILLVPEIGLTPSMAGQLHLAFGANVALLHSALTPDERAEQWHRIRRGEARIVVGTRSAVFAPVVNLGLIVVDEEHDSSYKQEEIPRYHARDVAVMRARVQGAAIVLGSATPSLESWQNAQTGKYALIEMNERVNQRPLPEVDLVDMRREFEETGREQLFSRALVERTRETIARGEQAMILLNRRGFSFAVLCRACGEKLECENCAISLTYHKPVARGLSAAELDRELPGPAGQRLKCHYCGYVRTVPRRCPACESEHLFFLGAGSQQGEERLQELFPEAHIGRMDRDTVRSRHDMERLLGALHSGEINLLVGTQMIAKGHDIHGVTLVGVVGADFALGLPDFRAAERVFQLLTQVSGRAGRGSLPGRVIVETYHPEHYAIQCAQGHDFLAFAKRELEYRKWMHYPPHTALANLLIQGSSFEEAAGWAARLGEWFDRRPSDRVRVLGPATAPIPRIKRLYRFHFVLKAAQRQALAQTLRAAVAYAEELGIPRRNLIADVDAVHLM